MFAKIKQVAAIGAAVAGIGWLTAVSPPLAYAQPPRISPSDPTTCSDNAEVNCDPNGSQQEQCPGNAPVLHTVPPECPPDTSRGKS